MPSVFTHATVPLALWCAGGRNRVPTRLLGDGVIAAMLPGADVLALALHIPYADAFGHRGASHSLPFATLLAAAALPLHRQLHAGRRQAPAFVFICALSHPLLDAFTSGGLGGRCGGRGATRTCSRRGGRSASRPSPMASSARAACRPFCPNYAGHGCRWHWRCRAGK